MQQINLYHALQDFQLALPPSFAQTANSTTSPRVKWISSSAYFFKINSDGVLFKDINVESLGVLVGDHRALVCNSFYS